MLVQAGFVLTIEPVSGLKILSQAPPRHAGRPKNGQRDGLGWAADDHNWALLVARGLSIARGRRPAPQIAERRLRARLQHIATAAYGMQKAWLSRVGLDLAA